MDVNVEKIISKINKITILNYLLTVLVFIAVLIFKNYGQRTADRIISTIVLVGATLFSVALPILLRTWFYQKSYKNKSLSQSDYLKLKTLIIISVLIGSLFALLGYYYPVYKYHLYISILVLLWGIYSISPSKKVIKRDFIDFKVEE